MTMSQEVKFVPDIPPQQQYLPPTPPSEPSSELAKMTSHTNSSVLSSPSSQHKHIWVITGPAGCGKTSVAEFLHSTYSLPYLEGDTVSGLV